jgi:hypothetical protein
LRKDQTLVPDVLRKLGLRGAIASLVVPVLALSLGVPAAAQFQSEGYQFLEAVKDREGNKATDMLNKPGNQLINTRDITSGDTGLHLVIADGDILWTRFLLQRGADPNIKNKKGETPLQRAVALDFTEGVAALLGNKIKANVNVTDSTGATPLITAVIGRRVALVRLLLAGGADPDRTDNTGRSARDHLNQMSNNTLLKQEFDAADKKRTDAGTKKNYGPSF